MGYKPVLLLIVLALSIGCIASEPQIQTTLPPEKTQPPVETTMSPQTTAPPTTTPAPTIAPRFNENYGNNAKAALLGEGITEVGIENGWLSDAFVTDQGTLIAVTIIVPSLSDYTLKNVLQAVTDIAHQAYPKANVWTVAYRRRIKVGEGEYSMRSRTITTKTFS